MPKISKSYLIPLLFTLLYALLPTHNSGIDGYAYASSIKWGQSIFWPHHLLYCPIGVCINSLINSSGMQIDILSVMKVVNALAAGACLFVLYKCFNELNIFKPHYFVILCGSCFGFMRFATENETYILPLLCSLVGTLLFIIYLKTQRYSWLLMASLCFGLGVLFHQIHGFWFAAFGIIMIFNSNSHKLKSGAIFILPGTILIALTYLLVYLNLKNYLLIKDNNFVQFIFRDVYAGQVNTQIGLNNFIMTPISFVRSFLQVHGYMKSILLENKVLLIIPLGMLIIGFVSIKSIIKNSKRTVPAFSVLSKGLLTAFLFQLGFAFYSVGNAEFMVMLPILATLYLITKFAIPVKPVLNLALIFLIYNIVFGLAPARFLDLDGSKPLYVIIQKHPNTLWLLHEPQKLENMIEYHMGPNIKPQQIMLRDIPEQGKQDSIIYTDLIEIEENLNRGNLLNKPKKVARFESYNQEVVDSLTYFGGKKVIYRLTLKTNQ
jgi:hypothetical protein